MSNPIAATEETPAWKPSVNPWLIAMAVMLATFLEVLDTSVANVALPNMAGSMASSLDEATWVLTSYLVANAIVLPMTGWLSGFFGRKRFLMVSTLLFTLASAACGMATSMSWLIFARILQGAAGGALIPLSQAILMESFPPNKRGLAMTVYGLGVIVAPIFGPVLGGWLTDNYSWRWMFYINVPFGALAIVLVNAFVEDPPYLREVHEKAAGKIDYVGFGAMALGLGALQIFLDRGQQEDWFNSTWICWGAATSVVSLAFFIFWELHTDHPIVDLSVFCNRNFAVGTFLITVTGFMIYCTVSLLPMFLQGLMLYPAFNSGMAMSPRGFGAIGALVILGKLSDKVSARVLTNVGWFFMAYSAWELGRITMDITVSSVIWPNIFTGVAMAFLFVPLTTISVAELPNEQMGNASGVFNLARNIGGSIGISLTTTWVARGAQAHQALMVGHLNPYDPEFQQYFRTASGMLARYGDPVSAQRQACELVYGAVLQQSTLLAFVDTFRLLALLSLLCVPVVFLLKNVKAGKGGMAMH